MADELSETRRAVSSPMEIAGNGVLTSRERIELLLQLKAEATGLVRNENGPAFSPEEIDEAIEEVRLRAQIGAEPSFVPSVESRP